MDRGCSRDPHQTGAQTEDGSAGCATAVDVAGGRSFSPDLGAERRKPGSAAAALASASAGANAHAHHEPVACAGIERRGAAQKGALAAGGESSPAVVGAGAVGQPTAARPAGVTGPTNSEDPGTDAGSGAGSGEATGGAATDDPSWGGSINRAGVRTGHRNAGALWLRQADRQLCGTGAVGGIQRSEERRVG